MNEALFNPFSLSHPTAAQATLYAPGALLARFDTTGRFIAAGLAGGGVQIFDLETRAPVRELDGHVKPITSIDWSRNSRYLLTSSKDWNVIVWDLASPCDPLQRHLTLRFDSPVAGASFHPKNSQIIVVVLTVGEAYVCDQRKDHKSRTELVDVVVEDGDDQEGFSRRSHPTFARFDPSGKHIWVGTATGTLLVFNSRTKLLVARFNITGATMMRGLEFSKAGRRLVTNSSDRTLRQFNMPALPPSSSDPSIGQSVVEADLEATHKFSDPINRTAWHGMSYSPDGEWLAGGAADPAGHKIYIWDIANDGRLATTLDGGSDPLAYVHWHPRRSVMASTTRKGTIIIWHHPTPERWGAFAGGFEEVDENVEYEEREDEFDIEDESVIIARQRKAEEEPVDIDTLVDAGPFNPSSEAHTISRSRAKTGGASTPIENGSTADANGMVVDMNGLDLDSVWAEEDPDGDTPDQWRMKVIMNNSAAEYY